MEVHGLVGCTIDWGARAETWVHTAPMISDRSGFSKVEKRRSARWSRLIRLLKLFGGSRNVGDPHQQDGLLLHLVHVFATEHFRTQAFPLGSF